MLMLKIIQVSLGRALRSRSERIVSFGFILSFSAVAALGIGPEAFKMPEIGVGLLWLALLLSLSLAVPNFVARDEEQGVLAQLQLLPLPLGAMLLAKALGVFLASMLPLLVCVPLIGIVYTLPWEILWQSMLCLLLGGWCYWLICASASMLLLGSARAAALQLLLTLPLGVPVLIFGCAASLRTGEAFTAAILLLAACALALSALSPWLMALLLRVYRRA